jgi:hypothetical protein
MRNAYTILFEEPVRKRLLESTECRCKDNNNFKEMDCERVDLVHITMNIAQHVAFVNTEMNFWAE